MGDAVAELRFLVQSESRVGALEVLSADAPLDRRGLESRLDSSYRTVVRNVTAFEERGYLEETEQGLRLTPFGSHLADELAEFAAATDVAVEFKPLLRHAPPALREIDPRNLAGAELLVASQSDPFSILDRILTLRAEATRIREIAPGVQKESIDQLAARVRSEEVVDVEAVLSQSASDAAESRVDYRDGHAAAVESDEVDIYVHPGHISFFAGVVDDTVAIAVSKDEQPYALAVSEDPDLRATVESLFEKYRSESALKTSV
jgi:predicted transcriptional regulator